jgi:uncharacterized membrane protein (UPF0127 family)
MDLQKIFRIGIGVAIALIVIIVVIQLSSSFSLFGKKHSLTIDKHTFQVDLAQTETQRILGLSGKKSLGANNGMLFTFPNADYHAFWMKSMNFPLDIIFINNDTIVTIQKNLKPTEKDTPNQSIPTVTSTAPADKVLEINAGLSDKYGFKVGDKVTFSL